MVSRFEGERLIIAATLDPVEDEQEFERIPPHMTVVRWFQIPEQSRRERLDLAMGRIFAPSEDPLYQNIIAGRLAHYGESREFKVRTLHNVETGPSFALRAFVRSLGRFREDDIYADTFLPHVTVESARKVRWREKLALPTVALISARSGDRIQRVEAAFSLGQEVDG